MPTIGATEARANFAELLRRASVGKQAIVIERRGKACAALVPIEDLELIEDRRKQARRSEERFESFAAAASDWFWEMDENCRFTYFSDRFTKVTGVPPEALLGKTREETGVPGVDPEEWRRHLADLAAHRSFRDFRHPRQHPERGTVHLSINGKAIFDEAGNFRGYRGTGSDITERRQAEEALRNSELQYRHIFEDSVVGTSLVAPLAGQAEGRFLRVNKAFCELLGYSEQELLGMTVGDVTHPEDREPTLQARRQLVDGEVDGFHLEKRYVHKSGRIVWAKLSITAVRDEAGRHVHAIGQHQDITELKRSEAALKKSEAKLREILEDSPIGVAIVSYATDDTRLTGTRLFLNDALVKMFGGASEAEMVGADISDSWVDLDRLRAFEEIMKSRAEVVDFEAKRRRLDGTEWWVSMHARPIRFDDQECKIIWHFDITNRQRTEQALRDSEARFRDLAEASADWFWEMDADLRFTYMSANVERTVGVPPEWHYGKSREDLLGDDHDRDTWDRHLETLREHKPFRDFVYRRAGEGIEPRWLRTSGLPVFREDGTFAGYRGCGSDVTERRLAEEASRQLSIAINAMNECVTYFDADDRLVFSNERHRVLNSAAPEMWVPGTTFEDQMKALLALGLVPEAQGREDEWLRERLDIHRRPKGPFELLRQDGIWMLVHEQRLPEGGMITLATDITERKAIEEQLRQSQKMEAVGQLTGGVAHDFNNLLAVITGNLELIAEDTGEDTEARHLAERALAAVDRGAALTQRLLAFSRRQALQPKVIDLNGLVAGINELLRRTLGETIEIESAGAADLWACEADPAQVESALLNLAINARDAMPDGGKLTIETANVTLDDDYAASHAEVVSGRYVTVTVTDTGTGMSKDVAAQAFEPFFTTKDVGKGSGLGLSMVYGFVKQSGGHVSIYSEPGEGTAVRIYLPKGAAGDAGASDKPRPAQAHLARGERIMVVEDDPDFRMLAVAMLQNLGYEVVAAENATAALTQLQDDPGFDLLLTDVVLPGGMSGRDLADHAQRLYPGFKVIYMSGYAENAIVHHGRLDEGVHLLQKPFRKADLAQTLRAVLDAG